MLRRDTLALTALLALLSAVGPLSTDMYLPSLPDIGRSLGAAIPQVQLTLSGFLLCFALGQIVYGPISDHVGRRPVLQVTLAIYVAASIGCALAPSVEALVVLRGVQAFGVAAAPVLARAIVRDLYSGARAGRELSRMGTIMALAPAIAPTLGGLLQTIVGWQANFYLMAAFGLYALVVVTLLLPETLDRPADAILSLSSVLRGYGAFLRHRNFLFYLAILSAAYGGLFAWISGSSFALQVLYGQSPLAFGLTFAASTLGYLGGTVIAAKLVTRFGINRTIVWGSALLATGGLAMLLATGAGLKSPLALALPITVFLVGLGLVFPQAIAGALTPFPDRAGAASSVLGFIQQIVAAAIGIVVGHSIHRSALPLAAIIAALGTLALVLAVLNRSWRSESQ
jgi:DHA1 family bicyclomycin/chloramphenicol resistance-like MFS transporter